MEPILKRYGHKLALAFSLVLLMGLGLLWMQGLPESVQAAGTLMLETSYKDADPREVSSGGTVDYVIVLQNTHDVSTTGEVSVQDVLEPRLEYVSQSWDVYPESSGYGLYSAASRTLNFTIFEMAPSTTVTLTFQALVSTTVQPGDVITNTATISDGVESYAPSVTVTVQSLPTVEISTPWNNQRFTDKGTVAIRGRVWAGSIPEDYPIAPTLLPITSGNNDWYIVQWSPVQNAMIYWLQESTTPDFSKITFEKDDYDSGTTSQYRHDMTRGQTYYYRLKARFTQYESAWSEPISVTVSTSELAAVAAPSAQEIAALTAPAAAPLVEIEIREVGVIDPPQTFNATVTADAFGNDWWDWRYDWQLPTRDDGQFVIEVRGTDAMGNYDPAKTDAVTVTVQNGTRYLYLPLVVRRYPPTPYRPSIALTSDDTYGNYKVTWSYEYTDVYAPTRYRFQQATDAGFTNLLTDEEILTSAGMSRSYTDKAVGTYYYRVYGINSYGTSPWSPVLSVVVNRQGYFDDFSNPNVDKHWKRKVYYRGELPGVPDGPVYDVDYENGSYRSKIMLNTDGYNNRRMGVQPSPYGAPFSNYDVEVRHKFVKADDQSVPPDFGKTGVIFAATSDYSTIYVVEWNIEGRCAVSKYVETTLPTTIIDFSHITYIKSWGSCSTQLGYVDIGDNDPSGDREKNYNREVAVTVNVIGTAATVSLNGHQIVQFTDSHLSTYNYVGLITGSWDRTPVESRFDDFSLMPR